MSKGDQPQLTAIEKAAVNWKARKINAEEQAKGNSYAKKCTAKHTANLRESFADNDDLSELVKEFRENRAFVGMITGGLALPETHQRWLMEFLATLKT